MNLSVRKARLEDIEEVKMLVKPYWEPTVDYLEECNKEESIFIVAEYVDENGSRKEILGMAIMWVHGWNNTGYLVEMAVATEHKREGIGKKLMDELREFAINHHLRAIIVETQPANRDAMDFYLAIGFRLCGFNDRYYTNSPSTSKDIAIFFSLDL